MGIVESLAFPGYYGGRYATERSLRASPHLTWLDTHTSGNDTGSSTSLGRRGSAAAPTDGDSDRVPCVWVRHARPRYHIVFSHGNATDVGANIKFVEDLARATECSVLAYEYPGYSVSTPAKHKPSERRCYRAARAALHFLTREQGVDPRLIVLFGRSLGTGPTVELAANNPGVAGTALLSPLASAVRTQANWAAGLLSGMDIFKNIHKVGRIAHPVFIMHGTRDAVVPCSNGRALHARLQHPVDPWWCPGAGHNNIPHKEIMRRMRGFVEELQRRQRADDGDRKSSQGV